MSDHRAELRDGTQIAVRPIRGSDREALSDAFERLSPESRYRRFFRPLSRLSSSDLSYLTEVDHEDHEALAAFTTVGELVGVARYIRSEEDPAYAEVAVTVADDWQSRGVGTLLLRRLIGRARESGITHFLALVLGDNRDAVELFQNLSTDDLERRPRDGHVELVIELPRDEIAHTALGRALRVAAAGKVEFNPIRLLKHVLSDNRPHR